MEVELPCTRFWCISLGVRKGDANLDQLEQVNIATHCLVVKVRLGFEWTYGTSYNTRKFCVLHLTRKLKLGVGWGARTKET